VLDQTGLAQKGGAVLSHVRIGRTPELLHAVRLAAYSADVILAGDLVVSASREGLSYTNPLRTHAVINTHETIVADFTRNPNSKVPSPALLERLAKRCKPAGVSTVEANRLATALFGDSIAANLFLLGYAYQKGLIPISAAAIEKAIELNAVQLDMNLGAFRTGRACAHAPEAVAALARPVEEKAPQLVLSENLDEVIRRRISFLTAYQNRKYAERYARLVQAVREQESRICGNSTALSDAVARNFFKLMAYKDEYEVARLHTDKTFLQRLRNDFSGPFRITFHLAPPILPLGQQAGEPRKLSFGPWMLPVFRVLARLKILRGTPLDIFGWLPERRMERRLIEDYETLLRDLLPRLTPDTLPILTRLAALPEQIRGYGHIKLRTLKTAQQEEATLLKQLGLQKGFTACS
jgi:indolepyruvate ferredoxin oxidoreductase